MRKVHLRKPIMGCKAGYFEKASLKGMVGGGGIDAANTAEDHVDIMKKAYELGKNL